MYVGFSRFLIALAAIGLGFGAVFGSGVAVGKGQAPKAVVANTGTGAAGAGAAAAPGAASGAAAGQGAGSFGDGSGGGAVTGSVDTVSATSMTVKTAAGESVTLTLKPQTTVRKFEDGAVSDIKQGAQVLVQRDSATSTATSVQLLPPGGIGGGVGGRGGAAPGASGTPGAGGGQQPSGTRTP